MDDAVKNEGGQIKAAIRKLFETSRAGAVYSEYNPLRVPVTGVNGEGDAVLCLHKHPSKRGALVLWYE